MTEYLGVAETAKLVRAAVRKAFPGVAFSVRSKSYSGGCSVDVRWTDGPGVAEVDAVAKQFQGKRFDGMIDMGWTADLWLLPDGSAVVASDPGSVGSMGLHEPVERAKPHPDARLIHTGAWVSCQREVSDALRERVADYIARRGGWEQVWRARDGEHAVWLVASRAMLRDGALVVRKGEYGTV